MKNISSIRRGDVVLVLFPFADDMTKLKKRPALVVQANNLKLEHPQLILAFVTSKVNRNNRPHRVRIDPASPLFKGSGLLTDSLVLADYLMTLNAKYILSRIGKIGDMSAVDIALKKALNL